MDRWQYGCFTVLFVRIYKALSSHVSFYSCLKRRWSRLGCFSSDWQSSNSEMQPKLSNCCNKEELIGDRSCDNTYSFVDRDSPVDYDDSEAESLIEKINSRIENHEKFFSLEFFPPRTKEGAVNLLARYFLFVLLFQDLL